MSKHHNTRRRQLPQNIKTNDSKPTQPVQTTDSFSNPLARLGYGQPNHLESTEYPLTRLTKNYQLMNSLYRSHWIIRKIIDTIPEDMCKNWIRLDCQVSPDALKKLDKLQRKTQVKPKVLEALRWGRLYGGAAALMMIAGHENILEEPLDYREVMPGSFKGLMVLDRWSGIAPGTELVTDINDPEFGLPDKYRITTAEGTTFDVHHSRILRFIGRDLPLWERMAETYWGCSEVEVIFDELKKRDNTSWNIAQLVFLANIRILKTEDLNQLLATQNIGAQEQLYNTITAMNWLMSNMGMQVLDSKDNFETHQFTFTGLNDVYQSFMLDMCGAAEIPMTRLFGRTLTGLGQSNEGDEQIYYDSIGQKQDASLRPVFDKLLPVMCMSEWGAIPDDLDYIFNPIGNPSNKDKAELGTKNTESILSVYNAGVIGRQTALKELRQQSEITGLFSNITDEAIKKADDDPEPGDIGNPFEGGINGTDTSAEALGTKEKDRKELQNGAE